MLFFLLLCFYVILVFYNVLDILEPEKYPINKELLPSFFFFFLKENQTTHLHFDFELIGDTDTIVSLCQNRFVCSSSIVAPLV